MQRITWYALLAVVALGASIAGWAQAPQAQAPQATVRELATIEGDVSGFLRLPGGRTLIYSSVTDGGDANFACDIATKRRTLLGTNMPPGSVSPQGDRFSFSRSSEDRTGEFVWTMPIDPKTGNATGQAQRVSLRPGAREEREVFSPDGKMLAFNAGPRPDGTWDVAVVPATGGAERVVANYRGPRYVAWAADGQSLYVEYGNRTAIERVPVTGGRGEALIPHSTRDRDNDGNIVGLSPDARVALILNHPDRFFYRTASGVEEEISVAFPPLDFGSVDHHFSLDSMLRLTAITRVRNQGVRVLDLTTGQARELFPGTVQTSAPAWSPDGRRLAVLTGSRSHYDITVVNADGSSPRRYPMRMHVEALGFGGGGIPFGAWEMPWSPDGRFLAFRANRAIDPDKVGYSPDDQDQLAVLDLDSGQTRVLATSSGFFSFVWRLDGKALRAIKHTRAGPGGPWRIVEVNVDGTERPLRDIMAEFPRANGVRFVSDREAVVRVATDQSVERFVVPLDGGAARRLPDPGINLVTRSEWLGGTAVAGNRLLIPQFDVNGEAQVIKILSTVGEPTRTLRLPFGFRSGFPYPDGKQFLSVGKASGDSLFKLFLVPFDGSAPRFLGEIPSGDGGRLIPSPDGKRLAYRSDGPITSKIHEIDFSPALQEIMKREPR